MKLLVLLEVLTFAVVAHCGVSMNNPFFCYMTDPIRSMTTMHSAFTSYEAIQRFNFATVNPYVSTCTPSRIWYLGRYGGRYPNLSGFNNMTNFADSSAQADIVRNYEDGRTTLCRQDFEAIRDWTRHVNFTAENSNLPSQASILTMQNIARRLQQAFPQILTETYSPDRFLFRHTDSERTNTSIRAFTAGLFGESEAQNVIYEEVPDNDWFLRPFDFCPAYHEALEFQNSSERLAFLNGPEFEEMLNEINSKLGFQGSNQLNFGAVYQIWNFCAFETSSTFEFTNSEIGEDSAWCAVFSVAHNLLIEYSEDMRYFYTAGYGVRNQRLLENLHCGLMQDLLIHIQSNDIQTTRVFISNEQEILGMLVTLGSFRDVWLLHQHNFAQQSARHWFTSIIIPQGANLSVVRFDCEDGDHDVIFLLNERPILVPGCDQQNGVCKVSVLVNRLQRFVDVNCEALYCSND